MDKSVGCAFFALNLLFFHGAIGAAQKVGRVFLLALGGGLPVKACPGRGGLEIAAMQ